MFLQTLIRTGEVIVPMVQHVSDSHREEIRAPTHFYFRLIMSEIFRSEVFPERCIEAVISRCKDFNGGWTRYCE
jgi:hypothetical protein